MRLYKNKETALRHIHKGQNLWTKPFQLFWCDKDVIAEAVVHRQNVLRFAFAANPDLKWDEEFMATLFKRILAEKKPFFWTSVMGRYLPPEITESKEIALQAAHLGIHSFRYFFAPDLVFEEDVRSAYSLANAPDTSMTREATASRCAMAESFRHAYGGLHDDEEFVLDVLKKLTNESDRAMTFATASYRIRKACRGQNGMDHLEKFVAAKHLDASLRKKSPIQQQRISRLKI
jgi:hypothetical protein